ncbi:MAG TPA: methyltransferase domain-containing protein [Candidatus Cloacimonadota bacterium]|nr:methyltransferase domain-containing protein [Candidatus Cloacimonadota bacterium]
MALPIISNWQSYFEHRNEGLGSSYERIILNKLLLKLKRRYDLQSILEAPIFGFTGLSGLNSYALSQAGCKVELLDHDVGRAELINSLLEELNSELTINLISSYLKLPYKDATFDLSWNFSALWFVEDLSAFLSEFTRVTKKAVLICVPNQTGLGFRWQRSSSKIPSDLVFHPEYVNPSLIKDTMKQIGWFLVKEDYIDCPPWPDIGMSKEKMLGKLFPQIKPFSEKETPKQPVNILNYYLGKEPDFADRMERLSYLERNAPDWFKKYWSHHRWMLFEPKRK